MILGLCGPKGVGKSTFARELTKDYDFRRISFADPLRDMLRSLLYAQECPEDDTDRILYGDLKETPNFDYFMGRTPRYMLQTLGTEWGRLLVDEYFWVNVLVTTVKNLQTQAKIQNFVVDDMRFKSEAKELKVIGAKLILIERDGYLPGEHLSEQEYLEIKPDFKIKNSKDPSYMIEQLKAANFPNL
jgi:hypothetical protein